MDKEIKVFYCNQDRANATVKHENKYKGLQRERRTRRIYTNVYLDLLAKMMSDSASSESGTTEKRDEGTSHTIGSSSDEYSSDSFMEDECSLDTSIDSKFEWSTSESYDEDDSDVEEVRFCSRKLKKWWLPDGQQRPKMKGFYPTPCDIYAFRLQDSLLGSKLNPFNVPSGETEKVEIEGYAFESSSSLSEEEPTDEVHKPSKPPTVQKSESFTKKEANTGEMLSFVKEIPPTFTFKKKGALKDDKGSTSTKQKSRTLHKSHFYPSRRKPKLKVPDDQDSSTEKSTSSGSSYEHDPSKIWKDK